MSDKSGIEWTDATWNPVTGCTKVSQGCKHCYAEREWARISAPRDRCKPNRYTGRAFTDVACHPDLLDKPLRWRKPRMIFVNSMSDLFHEAVPDKFVIDVFCIMARAIDHGHTFQVLTKRPERMAKFLTDTRNVSNIIYKSRDEDYEWPLPNVWLGVSCEDQATADERIPLLLQTPAAVRWVSAEPLLGLIMLDTYLGKLPEDDDGAPYPGHLDWIVAGGESGPQARPMQPEWARSIRDQCQASGVKFFFKQWGEWAPRYKGEPWIYMEMERVGKKAAGRSLDGRTWDEYPA